MAFRVDLDGFRGPLDLLLYLVRKHEVDIVDMPIAPITDQFLAHIGVLEQFDVNAVGDFVAMASWLMEIKSRMVLPHDDEVEEQLDDPRQELVQKLLEYKKYRDAASMFLLKTRHRYRELGDGDGTHESRIKVELILPKALDRATYEKTIAATAQRPALPAGDDRQ